MNGYAREHFFTSLRRENHSIFFVRARKARACARTIEFRFMELILAETLKYKYSIFLLYQNAQGRKGCTRLRGLRL